MTESFLTSDIDGRLTCPKCCENYVHIDDVFIAGRPREDGPVEPVHVDHRGQVREGLNVALPIPETGRRHVIALKGWCEMCAAHFTIEFKQHKGQTHVALREAKWSPLLPAQPND